MSIIAKSIMKSIGDTNTVILNNISVEIQSGEFVALTGRSGSGKSTFLYLLGSLDLPTSGSIEIDGMDLAKLSAKEISRFRNTKMGFVFQFHYLIAELSALENVLVAAKKAGEEEKRKEYAVWLLDKMGLKTKLNRLPRQLSGGEQQRLAIVRALVMEPTYLFADEPTGALDSVNADIVMKMLTDANQKSKTTVIMVTHDPGFAALANRVLLMVDGSLVS